MAQEQAKDDGPPEVTLRNGGFATRIAERGPLAHDYDFRRLRELAEQIDAPLTGTAEYMELIRLHALQLRRVEQEAAALDDDEFRERAMGQLHKVRNDYAERRKRRRS